MQARTGLWLQAGDFDQSYFNVMPVVKSEKELCSEVLEERWWGVVGIERCLWQGWSSLEGN